MRKAGGILMHSLTEGNGVFGKLTFKDGKFPHYDRPYLIVKLQEESYGLVVVSSTLGKEHKLHKYGNKVLTNFKPPFKEPSFVKIDSYVEYAFLTVESLKLLSNGQTLESSELKAIQKECNVL